MSWTTPEDLRAQVQRLWDKGLLLGSLVEGNPLFPRRLALKGPSSSELVEQFEQARTWIAELRRQAHYRMVLREVRHPILGANSIPDQIWVDTLDDATALISKCQEAKRFGELVTLTRACRPLILQWLARYPLRASELAEVWPLLLEVVAWIQAHPSPGIYLRQVDIPGIHTKFIEAHRTVLTELLDLTLPPEAINLQAVGAGQFCRRYGFRDKPLRIRFRILDPRLSWLPGEADQDIEVNHDTFACLETKVERVFITENETNFLAFPNLADSLVIFGAGYGFEMLAKATWLYHLATYYWGDIDTHGFAILDQLRVYLPQVQSFLMDRETLMAHTQQWGEEPQPVRRNLTRLNEAEHELFIDLRDSRWRSRLRLEQERVGFNWVGRALQGLSGSGLP